MWYILLVIGGSTSLICALALCRAAARGDTALDAPVAPALQAVRQGACAAHDPSPLDLRSPDLQHGDRRADRYPVRRVRAPHGAAVMGPPPIDTTAWHALVDELTSGLTDRLY